MNFPVSQCKKSTRATQILPFPYLMIVMVGNNPSWKKLIDTQRRYGSSAVRRGKQHAGSCWERSPRTKHHGFVKAVTARMVFCGGGESCAPTITYALRVLRQPRVHARLVFASDSHLLRRRSGSQARFPASHRSSCTPSRALS